MEGKYRILKVIIGRLIEKHLFRTLNVGRKRAYSFISQGKPSA
jgi:hypothetical protein